MRLNEIVLIFLWTKFPGHRVTPFRQVFQQSARARRWAMPGRIDIDAEDIPVLDQVSPKAPEGAVADYSAVALLGGHFGAFHY